MTRRAPLFTKESDLCAAFIAWAKPHGWTAYAETAGWDIVLVRPNGIQIGVQAKLRFNLHVMSQALPRYAHSAERGPDYRAILVGADCGQNSICDQLGLALFCPYHRYNGEVQFSGNDEVIKHDVTRFRRYGQEAWFDWNPENRLELPEYIPDVAAGASAPLQLTPWKIGALRLTALLELRGWLTRQDFNEAGVNPTRWTVSYNLGSAWLLKSGDQRGRWIRGPKLPHFEEQHPTVYPQIRKEVAAKLAKANP